MNMERKCYQAPRAEVNIIGQEQIICSSPDNVTKVKGNAGLNYGGGGSSPVRTKERGGIFGEAAEGGSIW